MPRVASRLTLSVLAAVGLTLGVAAPALAFAFPPTLSFAQPVNTEYTDAVVAGECPQLTTSFTLTAVVVGDPTQYDISAGSTLDDTTGIVTGSAVINALEPGTSIVVTLTCLGAGDVDLGDVDQPYVTNDLGAESVASAAGLNSPIMVTGTCGDGVDITDVAYSIRVNGVDPAEYPHFAYTGSPFTHDLGFTPADLGAATGDSILVFVACIIDGDPQVLVAASTSTFVVSAAAPAPSAALPATGAGLVGPVVAAVVLLLAGGTLFVLRRRNSVA